MLCVLCVRTGAGAGERPPGFVVMGVSVIPHVQARNRPHTEALSFRREGIFVPRALGDVAC